MYDFDQAFPLIAGDRPAVKWSEPANCRPTETFPEGETYGLPTGPRNGIVVVDLDRKGGKDGVAALMAYAADLGVDVPETYTVATKSNGLHLYFQWDDTRPVRNRAGVLEGLDVRGDGGYVRAGGVYVPVSPSGDNTELTPIADMPDWLYDLIKPKDVITPASNPATSIAANHPEFDYRIAKAREYLLTQPPCIQGKNGQGQLWQIALRMTRTYELSPKTCWGLLSEGYNERCTPPWSEAEALRAFARAAEHGTGPTGMPSQHNPLFHGGVPKVPSLTDGNEPFRQYPDPNHQYGFDLAQRVSGGTDGIKVASFSAKELAAVFAGPGAHEQWRGVWQYDLFRQRVRAVNPPLPLNAETIGLTEMDLARIQVTLACDGVGGSLEQIRTAITVAASECSFHPVRDYLDKLPAMDAKSAADYFDGIAGRLWGAEGERNGFESGHLKRFAIAAVRRVRKPGTKVDVMLILTGEQGWNKSRFCAQLFGEYFLDQMPALDSWREASIALAGYWGIEMPELRGFSKAQENAKKEFLSRSVDKYRPVNAKETIITPRQCVFIGTTNEDDFLGDPTGDRRYDICEILRPIDLGALDRDQFWAAANALESAGESHFVHKRADDGSSVTSSSRYAADEPWANGILAYVKKVAGKGAEHVTAAECLSLGAGVPLERQTKEALNRAKGVLRRHLGSAVAIWRDDRTQRGYSVKRG